MTTVGGPFVQGWQRNSGYAQRVSDPGRERTISRLAVLKAAAEFAASRPDLKSADVLRIGDVWFAWVNKS
jgi:hypothetical protein